MNQTLPLVKNTVTLLFFLIPVIHSNSLNAQSSGDYRSKKTGLWTDTTVWETYNGTAWVTATKYPTYKNGNITIESDTVTIQSDTIDLDQVSISTNGRVNLKEGAKVNLRNGKADDLVCNGYFSINNSTLNFVSGSSFLNNQYGALSFQAGNILQGNGNFTNTGKISLGASLLIPDSVVFNCKGGRINGPSYLTIQGTMNLTNGDINASLTIVNTAVCNFNATSNSSVSNITNNGTINWNKGSVDFQKKAVLTNNGQFNIFSTGNLTNYEGGHPTLYNSSGAKIKRSGNYNYSRIALDINNNGSVIIDSGTFVTSGAFHNYHILNIGKDGSYENDGVYYADSSELLQGTGDFYNAGTCVINYKDTIPKKIEFTNDGLIQGTGELIIPGTINFGGNCLIPITITKTGTGEGLITQVYSTFTNDGALNLYGGNANISGEFINNGIITTSDAPRLDAVGKSSKFINNGEIKVAGGYGEGLSIGSPFTNSSTGILEGSGSFGFKGLFTNEGSISPGLKTPARLAFGINPIGANTTLNIGIGKVNGGKTKADEININNVNTTLGGTLNLFRISDAVDTGYYTIVIPGYDKHINGSFSKINKPADWTVEYQPTAVVVHITSAGLTNGIAANASVTGINSKINVNLVIYPNPVGSIINIMNLNAKADNNLSIRDTNGKLVTKAVAKGSSYTWNIGNLASGIYYIVVESNGETRTQKFVKE